MSPRRSIARSARRLAARLTQRCAEAFVIDAVCPDGTRLLIGLDPGWAGTATVTLAPARTTAVDDAGSPRPPEPVASWH